MDDSTQFAAEFHADVAVEKIAEVYAEAFLNAIDSRGESADEKIGEFSSFVAVLRELPKFDDVISSAMVSTEEKLALIDKAVGHQASPTFKNFLGVVAKRGRLDILRAIHFEATKIIDKRRNRIPVTLTTAVPLDEQVFGSLSEKLRGVIGGEPIIKSVVDPETIGGLVVRVGDTVYDASLLTQLKTVRQQMIDRSAHEIQSRRDSFRNPEGN
jgi:F-type H+-transporting ATPase subunit delta